MTSTERHYSSTSKPATPSGASSGATVIKLPSAKPAAPRPKAQTFTSSHFKLSDGEVQLYMDRKSLEYRTIDKEINLRLCPFCHPHNFKETNLWKLYFSKETGVFFCHRCSAKGSWFDFKRLTGDKVESAGMSDTGVNRNPKTAIPAVLPDQTLTSTYVTALKNDAATMAYLTGSDPSQQRGLKPEVLEKYRVGVAEVQFPNPDGSWQPRKCVTFPWMQRGQDGEPLTLRFKHRDMEKKGNQRLEPKGGSWGLFGMHTVPADATTIVLTEGEYDAMAVHQATGLPAVSLPNGCTSLPLDVIPLLEPFEKIYLWLDDDVPGQDGASKMARKLGIARCHVVRTRGGKPSGPKDANDLLRVNGDFQAVLDAATPVPHGELLDFTTLREEVQRELANPAQVAGIQSETLPSLNRILKGHRRGELTVLTGPTGSGKTSILSQISLDYCARGVPTLWGSFELSNARLAKKMLQQYASKNLEAAMHEFYWADKFAALPLHFMRFSGSTDINKVLDAMEYAVYVHDVEHVILDNLQFMMSGQGKGYEKFDTQDRAIELVRKFATNQHCHVTLVIHPRKEDDFTVLNTSSVFGTAKATQEADNVVILQRGRHYSYLDVKKNRFAGELGQIPYRYEKNNGKIYELNPEEAVRLESGTQWMTIPGSK